MSIVMIHESRKRLLPTEVSNNILVSVSHYYITPYRVITVMTIHVVHAEGA